MEKAICTLNQTPTKCSSVPVEWKEWGITLSTYPTCNVWHCSNHTQSKQHIVMNWSYCRNFHNVNNGSRAPNHLYSILYVAISIQQKPPNLTTTDTRVLPPCKVYAICLAQSLIITGGRVGGPANHRPTSSCLETSSSWS